jgi:hypothetical protein
MKPNINLVEVHPQLSNNGHPMDGARVGAGSLWLVITNHLVPVIPCLMRGRGPTGSEFWLQEK